MNRLRLRVPNAEDWQRYFDPNISGGGIFCPTSDPPEVGSEVRIEITFISGPRFFIDGVVMWRRPPLKDPRTRAGIGVRVHPRERSKVSYVNAWARGGVIDKRDQRRLPVRLRVTYSARSGRRINFTRDISEEGVFIRSQELLPLDTPIKLLLAPPKPYPAFELKGRVTHIEDESTEQGMGIRLEFESDVAQATFVSLVHQLEEQYLVGQLPDEVIV